MLSHNFVVVIVAYSNTSLLTEFLSRQANDPERCHFITSRVLFFLVFGFFLTFIILMSYCLFYNKNLALNLASCNQKCFSVTPHWTIISQHFILLMFYLWSWNSVNIFLHVFNTKIFQLVLLYIYRRISKKNSTSVIYYLYQDLFHMWQILNMSK